jgi:superoxide reductase
VSAEKLQIYKCDVCGIVAEVLEDGAGELVCCGRPMRRLAEDASGAARELHVPVATKVEGGLRVCLGDVPHPMDAKHFILWIELLKEGRSQRQFLRPGQKPEAFFALDAPEATVRALCSQHGLWTTRCV